MSQKLFVLGLPGSGKSTVSRYIVEYIKRFYDGYSVTRICDYDILLDMFCEDSEHINFYPTEHKGFYVKNPSMYDEALKKLEKKIEDCNFPENEIILIEFARSDYVHALKNFSPYFLQDACFLFLDVDIEIGMKRVKERIKRPSCRDDHFVSKYTFEFYRQRDNAKYLLSEIRHLTRSYGIKPNKIKVINNRGSKRDFWEPVNNVIMQLLEDIPAYA